MRNNVLIKEVFESIQGEGPYVGVNQLFIRFTNCNLNCKYCDTNFKSDLKEYTTETLLKEINNYKNIHSISLTGGEPLLESEFLKNFLPKCNQKIYLETNGTLYKNLEAIINNIDIISMDIKLPSTTNMKDMFNIHEEFIKIAIENKKEIFAKVVFDEKITEEEIIKTTQLAQKYNIEIILQPKMDGDFLNISTEFINKTFYRFIEKYDKVRLIPQVHKFINIR